MTIGQYWVGQIPLRDLSLAVKDSSGRTLNCTSYTDVSVRIRGSHNEEVSLVGSNLTTTGKSVGRFVFTWPSDRSLFTEAGDYVLQMILGAPGVKDMTTTYTMRVKDLGKVDKKNVYNR